MEKPGSDGHILLGRSFSPMPAGEPDAQPRFGDAWLDLRLANRHGLVTGATGTGKTVTLQVLAEGFSRAGVPVFAPDIKGDLSGIAARGEARDFLVARAAAIGIAYAPETFPVEFWDLFGTAGHPIRATVSEMGPLLIARLLGLNDTQEGVLNIAFRVADEEGMLLLDLKDLRALMTFVGDNAASLGRVYGNVAPATVGAIQRQLLVLENQGADAFFGEPALKIADLMRVDAAGRGVVNLLAADRLMGAPRLYACFLLWLLSELFEELPEVGDLDKPKLVFFFDEAHLLFDAAPKVLLEKVEQVVRLIRSKGVGVYFVTQNPLDVPDKVLSQLGNRVQHALRAFTPRDQKAVKAAAETFRPNPEIDTAAAITELGKGEALVSVLEGNGTPTMVARTLIAPPRARVGPIAPELRAAAIARSPLRAAYGTLVDRHSAFEMLRDRAAPQRDGRVADGAAAGRPAPGSEPRRGGTSVPKAGGRSSGPATPAPPDSRPPARPSTRMSTSEAAVRQMARSAASEVGRQLGRAILRGLLGGLRR